VAAGTARAKVLTSLLRQHAVAGDRDKLLLTLHRASDAERELSVDLNERHFDLVFESLTRVSKSGGLRDEFGQTIGWLFGLARDKGVALTAHWVNSVLESYRISVWALSARIEGGKADPKELQAADAAASDFARAVVDGTDPFVEPPPRNATTWAHAVSARAAAGDAMGALEWLHLASTTDGNAEPMPSWPYDEVIPVLTVRMQVQT